MSEGHHTKEQVDKAFAAMPKLLRRLEEAGCENPSVELFSDASGCVLIGRRKDVTEEQIDLAVDLVKSRRISVDKSTNVIITSCCGFVSFAEEDTPQPENATLTVELVGEVCVVRTADGKVAVKVIGGIVEWVQTDIVGRSL